ncbi:MAG: thrombospondin type 3 repeat-containing protein, partial [Patescibacteria group bacterium]
ILRKLFVAIIILALLGVGAYFVYSKVLLPQSIENDKMIAEEQNNNIIIEEEVVEEVIIDDVIVEEEVVEEEVVIEEEVDIEYLKSIDSDNDGLSDYDEVYIFGTDPLNPDSDEDGYFDGSEVLNGYNPLGNGPIDSTIFVNPQLFYENYPEIVEAFNL